MDKYIIESVSNEESPLFYSAGQECDKKTGCIGHMRLDFGRDGDEFWHTWTDHCFELNTQHFKNDFQDVINTLRKNLLRNLSSMSSYCYNNPQTKIIDGRNNKECFPLFEKKPSLMDKVESRKQKAVVQKQPDKVNKKRQEALE